MAATALRFGEVEAPAGLAGWAPIFMSRPGPRIIAAALAATAAARVVVGGWDWTDLLIAGLMVGLQPFTEWVTHVFLLHARPVRIGSRSYEPYAARKHRLHHLDPKDVDLVLVPLPIVLALIGGAGLAIALFGRDGNGLTAGLTGFTLLFVYEWTHFLIHSPHRPKSRYYRALWRAHRLHHYRNERYWYGITSSFGDRVLRTYPARSEVDMSPTARTLAA